MQSSPATSSEYQHLVVVHFTPPHSSISPTSHSTSITTTATTTTTTLTTTTATTAATTVANTTTTTTTTTAAVSQGQTRTPPLSCRQLEEVAKQLKEEEEEDSSLTGFLDSPDDADVKLNPSLLEGLVNTLSPEGESGTAEAAVKKEEKGMWERDSGALPPPGEEEGTGWGGGEPSGADTAAGPNHLLHLVHLLGEEITTCEAQLKDELDQRKRYKVDDSRRTHNYDQFIITFLAMLAEQGKISDLVKEQLQPSRKRPAPAPSTPRPPTKAPLKKTESKSPSTSKKRGRKKKTKGKRKR
ncbi:Ubiquitin carboxyl-terminal hydrolase BAP1 [Portunus trituberculatus]|uniref:Ubiquitin carboxyl-terminal hydrolase BAP1 n=2 Tax=Portunus trituberculatus TaxID=210409 RepID=A0A5B7CY84_PORTR|nr:Ubiquitin carboxyl-terminal hydrolase BAP1 [Portunus trituberculatus]